MRLTQAQQAQLIELAEQEGQPLQQVLDRLLAAAKAKGVAAEARPPSGGGDAQEHR